LIVTTSWDDGHPLDFRVAERLAWHGLPGTFYVPLSSGENPVLSAAEVRRLEASGFEIGAHGQTHRRLPGLPPAELQREVPEAKAELEERLGHPVAAFCYPGGKHDARARRAVRQAGFAGARVTARYRVRLPRDPWRWPTSIQAHGFSAVQTLRHLLVRWNPPGLSWWLAGGRQTDWVALALRLLDWADAEDGVWHLWGHSWEVDAAGEWGALETVLREAAARTHARRLTNGELFRAHPGRP
jgi:peptidoglycan-N-acetylglucosamine deacetylase